MISLRVSMLTSLDLMNFYLAAEFDSQSAGLSIWWCRSCLMLHCGERLRVPDPHAITLAVAFGTHGRGRPPTLPTSMLVCVGIMTRRLPCVWAHRCADQIRSQRLAENAKSILG